MQIIPTVCTSIRHPHIFVISQPKWLKFGLQPHLFKMVLHTKFQLSQYLLTSTKSFITLKVQVIEIWIFYAKPSWKDMAGDQISAISMGKWQRYRVPDWRARCWNDLHSTVYSKVDSTFSAYLPEKKHFFFSHNLVTWFLVLKINIFNEVLEAKEPRTQANFFKSCVNRNRINRISIF